MSRRTKLALLAIAVVAVLGYTAYWFHAASLVKKSVENWADHKRAEGWTVAYSDMKVSGYPLSVVATVSDPSIGLPNGAEWHGEHLSMVTSPFGFRSLRLRSDGRHSLTWGPFSAEGQFASLRGKLVFSRNGTLKECHVTATGADLTADNLPIKAEGMAISITALPTDSDVGGTTPTMSFIATTTGLELPEVIGVVLDRRVAMAELGGKILGQIPSETPPMTALAQWSSAGGTVEVEHLMLDWAPLALEADGTIALDGGLQPLAAFSTRIRGFNPLMDRLAEARVMEPAAAAAAKAVLTLMAKPDPHGRNAVPVPVTVQDGQLWLGPAQVANVPAIPWPDGPVVSPEEVEE